MMGRLARSKRWSFGVLVVLVLTSIACTLGLFQRAGSGAVNSVTSVLTASPGVEPTIAAATIPSSTSQTPTLKVASETVVASTILPESIEATAAATTTDAPPTSQQMAKSPPHVIEQSRSFPGVLAIDFVDAQSGWAVIADSRRLLRTADGGETWRDVTPDDIHVWSASIVDVLSAWTVDMNFDPGGVKDVLYRTLDGGATWQSFQTALKQSQVTMLDALNGWAIELPYGCAVGSCWFGLYTTTDGGGSWKQLPLVEPEGTGDGLFLGLITLPSGQGVWLSDLDTIWLYGDQTFGILQGRYANLTVSRDAGNTWEELVTAMPDDAPGSGVPHYISYPTFLSRAVGYFSAIYSNPTPENELPSGYIAFFSTQDGGHSWTALPSVVEINPYAVFVEYVSQQRFILLCQQKLCLSKDGGRNWDVLESNIEAVLQTGAVVVDIDFVNNQRGWIALRQDTAGTTLYRTVDGGSTWDPLQFFVE